MKMPFSRSKSLLKNPSPQSHEAEALLESAIVRNLGLSYEERIEAHENSLHLVSDLRRAGEEARGKSQKSS